MKLPSTKAYTDAFGSGLLVPSGDEYTVKISGWSESDKAPTGISLRCERDGARAIDISFHSHASWPERAVLHKLLLRAIMPPDKLEFPYELRVDRTELRTRIDGRPQTFTALRYGSRVVGFATVGGVAVEIGGEHADLDDLALRRFTREELKPLLREKRLEYAKLEKQGKRRS